MNIPGSMKTQEESIDINKTDLSITQYKTWSPMSHVYDLN